MAVSPRLTESQPYHSAPLKDQGTVQVLFLSPGEGSEFASSGGQNPLTDHG